MPGSWLRSPCSPRGRDAWLVLLLLVSLGATAPYFGRLMNANERPRILQAMAWVDAGELAVDGPAARGIDPGIDVARSPVDGRLYPNKPPGATVPAVIAYAGLRGVEALGGPAVTLRSLTIAARVLGGLVPTLVLVLVLARRLRRRGAGRVGDAAVLWIALATPLTSYARLLYGHALAAGLLVVGTGLVLDAIADRPASADDRGPAWRRALLGGGLAASAVTVEYLAAFAGIPLALAWAWRWRTRVARAPLIAAAVGAAVPVLALAGYHAAVFGSPWSTGYHHVVDPGFAQTHAQGLLGLRLPTASSAFEHWLSPWGGILVWAPVVVLGAAFGAWRWRSLDVEARVGTAIVLGAIAILPCLAQTGGWRVGPRYVVFAMPFAAYGLVHLGRAVAHRPVLAVGVTAVVLASTVMDALAANLFPHVIPHGNPGADLLLPLALEGRMPSCVLPGVDGVSGWGLALVVGAPLGLVSWGLWQVADGEARTQEPTASGHRSRRWLVLGLGAVGALGLLLASLAWPEHPEAASDRAAVESIWEPDAARPRRPRVLGPIASP